MKSVVEEDSDEEDNTKIGINLKDINDISSERHKEQPAQNEHSFRNQS